ncbi:MAG: hypothetical protein EPO01_07890 [Aquabacterium sp.]|nr:MAG: hypothetical protein EPO01_07890 [Aquabacterium sp.]
MSSPALVFDASQDPQGDGIADEVLKSAPPAAEGHYDELRDAQGGMREPWQRFFCQIGPAGLADLDRREALLARQIHEDGVTYNVYSDPGGAARSWPLELLPMLIEPQDWRQIEAGVQQRAQLLNTVLADIYGEQSLLRDSLLPPSLVLGHPGYVRSLHGHRPTGDVYLHIVAFDLARGPDGRFWVMDQRTQAPSGLGYALENRMISSRLFPQAFRELNVQHLASGYRRLLDTLQVLAAPAAGGELPRLALLTPGPYNETYFEHAYLARYLGLPLVEGGDLTVRDECLYLKTVNGLERVHGLLRRLDDDYCDPLELRPDSALGVPGLLQAVRAGNVVMANALGTGFLESPAVQGFLPGIAQHWLGQDLLLPSLPTWWCGEAAAWESVAAELQGKVVASTFPPDAAARSMRAAFEPTLLAGDEESLLAWRVRVHRDPDNYTIRTPLAHSRSPAWSGGEFQERGVTLRVYAISDGHGGWQVLPGGMARTASAHAALPIQQGGASLDAWVLTDGAVDTFSMLPSPLRVEDLTRQQRPVSSRTAENLFWMGRYTERTENLSRLARVLFSVLGEDDEEASPPVLDALSELAYRSGLVSSKVPSLGQSVRVFERAVVEALPKAWDASSVAYNLRALSYSAGSLRDRLSPDHWRLIRDMGEQFSLRMQPGFTPLTAAEALPALDWLDVQLSAVTGAQFDRMTRDAGWRMLAVGRYVERLVAYADILRIFFERGAASHPQGFDVLLALFDSTITFRSRFQRRLELPALLDLLVMDEANPRALGCVLRRLRIELRKLPQVGGEDTIESLLSLLPPEGVGQGLAELCDPLWSAADAAAAGHPVPRLAERLGDAAASLSDRIGWHYFAHAGVRDRLLAAS